MDFRAQETVGDTAVVSTTDADQPGSLMIGVKHQKVLILSDAARGRNGVGTFYLDLMEKLRPYVADVELIDPGPEVGGLALPLPGDRTQKVCIPNPQAIKKVLLDRQPDVLLLATPGAYGLMGAWWARRLGIPVIVGFHTSFEQIARLYWNNSIAGRVVHGYFRRSHTWLFRQSAMVLANSASMVAEATAAGANEAKLVGTLLSPTFIDQPIHPHTGNLTRVIFAGRLAPEKNIEAIIRAAGNFPSIGFTLAGDGPLRPLVEEAAARLPNICCRGWLSRESLCEQIDRHDALLLPSHFESFGTVALEAMARQRLVIVGPGCGIATWPEFADGLCLMGATSLSETLGRLIDCSPAQRRSQAAIARQVALAFDRASLHQWLEMLTLAGRS